MMAAAGFVPVTEVTADGRARIAFGRAGVHENDRFAVSRNASGEILLTPLASIPARELVIWENDELRGSLVRGFLEASTGRVDSRDDLLDDATDDDE